MAKELILGGFVLLLSAAVAIGFINQLPNYIKAVQHHHTSVARVMEDGR